MVVSLATIPAYLHEVGLAGYGVLSLAWTFLYYFTVFDPGLSRACAYRLAQLPNGRQAGRVFWTALALNTSFGALGGVVLLALAQPMFSTWIKMPAMLRPEMAASLIWLAAAVPVGTIAAVLNGALQGRQKFALINTVNAASGIALQVLPLCIAWRFGAHLPLIIGTAVLVRLATAMGLLALAIRHCGTGWPRPPRLAEIKSLFTYGSWVSVSNIIIPVLVTADKFLIAICLGATDVALYTLPDNLTRRVSVIPASLVQSLFPRFAAGLASGSQALLERSFMALLAILAPVTVAGILFMQPCFHLWLGGREFAQSAEIGTILLAGIFINSLAFLPSTYLQAIGRPQLPAKFHVIEVIPHLAMLFIGIRLGGLPGAAGAMLAMNTLDAALLFRAAGLRIWRIAQFRAATALVTTAFVLARCTASSLALNIAMGCMFSLACLLYFAVTTPEISRPLRRLSAARAKAWLIPSGGG
jgi:O-antigen/teichoic acid export membrane protein